METKSSLKRILWSLAYVTLALIGLRIAWSRLSRRRHCEIGL